MAAIARKELSALTSLRFVAAFMIVVHHFSAYFVWHWYGTYPLGSGVSFFFVLSGFVLQYSYPSLESSQQVRRFVWLRFARLWPLHILCLALPLLLIPYDRVVISRNPEFLLFHVTMLQSWVPIQISTFNLNGPAWSISTELFFYLLFPVLLWVRTVWGWAVVALVISVFFVGAVTVGCVGDANLANADTTYTGLSCYTAAQAFPVFRLPEFALGMLLCRLFNKVKTPDRAAQSIGFTALEALSIAIAALYLKYLSSILSMSMFDIVRNTMVYNVLELAAPAPIFGIVILVFALERGHISRFLSAKIFVLLGEISFSLYLIHVTIIKLFRTYPEWIAGLSMWTVFSLYVAIGLATSYLIYTFFEKPIRSAARKVVRNSGRNDALHSKQTVNV
ncbi:acyltransferase [Ochrobactrum sp. Marseille-Q0166]|uniref:acyltransferase family protein n=1 Tax=Ochrobactrum sp. Marseille-Q0166 TaxID=2761105 RepID=UPI0016561AC2|nr:acyltransferase [Ochrobactrum sp. Marseille-Q0166]MBC8718765.1 acyltransferase [Ochrobactrum sp. Marseille-Q0166]